MSKSRTAGRVAGALLIGAVLVACGSSAAEPEAGSATTAAPATSAPPTTTAPAPQRIISLSPTHTEILFAIGAGSQVIAVDTFSNHPPEAAAVASDLSAYEPNIEAIAAFEPDLVVTEGSNTALLGQLDTLAIPHWSGSAPADLEGVYTQILDLGAVVGRTVEAEALVAGMRAEVERLRAEVADLVDRELTYYHELDSTYYSVTSDTFIGSVYAELGLRSIADAAGGGQYPQLNAEFILTADPDVIFLACTVYCGETAASVAARPGWGVLAAVQAGRVVEMDDDVVSRWGPRIVEAFAAAAAAVASFGD